MKDLNLYNSTETTDIFIAILKSLIVSIICVFSMSILFSILVGLLIVPTSFIGVISFFELAFGGLVAGFIVARKVGHNGMVMGMIIGALLLFIIIILGLLFQSFSFRFIDISQLFVKLFELLLSGAVGGIAGINVNLKQNFKY